MTFGLTTYQSVVNQWPIVGQLVPDSIVRDIDNVRMLFEFAAKTERDALATANRTVDAHNRGILTANDYRNYDAFRHKTYDTQVTWLREIREQLYAIPGGSVYANRIPWPTWLQPIRPESPRNLVAQSLTTSVTSGAAGLGAAPLFVGVAGIVLIVVLGLLAAFVFDRMADGARQWMVLKAQSSAIDTSIEARRDAFNACVQAGSSAEVCAAQVAAAIPAPSQAAIDRFVNQSSDTKGFVYYAGIFTIIAGLGGFVWYGNKQGWFKRPGW
jgi:hypothetical protein